MIHSSFSMDKDYLKVPSIDSDRRTRNESGYTSDFSPGSLSAASPMPPTPGTPAMSFYHSVWSPHSNHPPASNYTEEYSESEDEQLDVDNARDLIDFSDSDLPSLKTTETTETWAEVDEIPPPTLSTVDLPLVSVDRAISVQENACMDDELESKAMEDYLDIQDEFQQQQSPLLVMSESQYYSNNMLTPERQFEFNNDVMNFTELTFENEPDCWFSVDEEIVALLTEQEPYFLWDNVPVKVANFKDAFNCWKGEQLKTPELPEETVKAAVKCLFFSIFNDFELRTKSLSGKKAGSPSVKDSDKLDPIKILAIERILGYLKHCWNTNKTLEMSIPDGNSFCQSDLGDVLSEKELKYSRYVFTSERNQKNQKSRKATNKQASDKDASSTSCLNVQLPDIEWTDGECIGANQWAEMFRVAHNSDDSIKKASSIVFKQLFTEDEIKNSTLSGRRDTLKLDSFKKEAVLEIVHWMQLNKTKYPYAFPKIPNSSTFKSSCSESMRKLITNCTFVDKRSQQVIGIKKATEAQQESVEYKKVPSKRKLVRIKGETNPPKRQLVANLQQVVPAYHLHYPTLSAATDTLPVTTERLNAYPPQHFPLFVPTLYLIPSPINGNYSYQ